MDRRFWPRPLPIVALLCGLIFMVYGGWLTQTTTVVCEAPQEAMASAMCQVETGWPGLATRQRSFPLQTVAVTSELCDNTPRGGVRFCHRLTLGGDRDQYTLPNIRTPLSATALTADLQRFMAGEASPQLVWSEAHSFGVWLRLGAVGLLLAIAAWGLWDIQWPAPAVSPLALDGALDGTED
jgi:hypothetical protein